MKLDIGTIACVIRNVQDMRKIMAGVGNGVDLRRKVLEASNAQLGDFLYAYTNLEASVRCLSAAELNLER